MNEVVAFSAHFQNPSPEILVIVRLPKVKLEPYTLYTECQLLCKQTKYKRCPRQEDAPALTDCLTSVHYLYKKTAKIEMSLEWIGNMPRALVKKWGWSIAKISRSELQSGDLIFVRDKAASRRITHVVLALSADKVFHSSMKAKGGRIEDISDIFTTYTQSKQVKSLLAYIDPRTSREERKNT